MQYFLSQIIGLTASLGVEKSKDESASMHSIMKLLANLDCQQLVTVTKHIKELEHWVNHPEESEY